MLRRKKLFANLTGIILLIAFCISETQTLFPYAEYILNQQHIAGVLCVNKDVPELQCNGRCYLNKQLKKAADHSHHQEKTTGIEFKWPLFHQSQEHDSGKPVLQLIIQQSVDRKKIFSLFSSAPPTPPPKIG